MAEFGDGDMGDGLGVPELSAAIDCKDPTNDAGQSRSDPCGGFGVMPCDQGSWSSWKRRAADVIDTIRKIREAMAAIGDQSGTAGGWVGDSLLYTKRVGATIANYDPIVPAWVSSHFAAPSRDEVRELADLIAEGCDRVAAGNSILTGLGGTAIPIPMVPGTVPLTPWEWLMANRGKALLGAAAVAALLFYVVGNRPGVTIVNRGDDE